MKAYVDEDLCGGCGPCEEICPEVFEIVDGMAEVKMNDVPAELESACREAMDNCPTDAISLGD